MNIQLINNQAFGAKKFRLPLKSQNNKSKSSSILVKEYENPNAGKIWNKIMNTDDFNKKINLLDKMGKYHIVDLNIEKTFKNV